MGANHKGEIARLSMISDPGYGIITNIGKAHLEGFGSLEGVIKAKSELYDHIAGKKGVCFVDSGNSLLIKLAKDKSMNVIYYGNGEHSECSGQITDNKSFINVKIHFTDESEDLEVATALVGDYNLSNILASASVGKFFGVPVLDIISAIRSYEPSNNRSQLIRTEKNTVVMDSYNANPVSMKSSIKNFLGLRFDNPRLMILGDMLELGKYSQAEHQSILELLNTEKGSLVILVGKEFCSVAKPGFNLCFNDVNELIEHLQSNPVVNHSILIKGSRGIMLDKLLRFL
jgi:UDP-N-acetylmuramoyl-tripeptide--D-alanyl-D-alanine ligase